MIEEFQNKKGAFISDNGISLEFKDFEIRDLHNGLSELIVSWDKEKEIGNKNLSAYSDFQNHVMFRIGEQEFGLNVLQAMKLYFDLNEAIKQSLKQKD